MTKIDDLKKILKKKKIVKTKDIEEAGIKREYILRLLRKGYVKRLKRGLYCLSDVDFRGFETYIEALNSVRGGVLCNLSALNFHGISTQISEDVTVAVKKGTWIPENSTVSVKYFYYSDKQYSYGIEKHKINNVTLRVYSVPKTIADCFKFRNKLGIDTAIESLKDALLYKKATVDEIYKAAKVCRVSRIIRPYLESII